MIIPTSTERESNARRVTALDAGEVVMPVEGPDGEKQIDVADFGEKVNRCLTQASYRLSARRISESMRQYGGAEQAANLIEQLAGGRV